MSETKQSVTNVQFEASFEALPCYIESRATASLTLTSQDGSPFTPPPDIISCYLSSPGAALKQHEKCNVIMQGSSYNIKYTPLAEEDQLVVKVDGVEVAGSPFPLPIKLPLELMKCEPKATITGLNKPRCVAVCDGTFVVTEIDKDCVTILKDGEKVASLGTRGIDGGNFMCPRGVAVSNDGHILVTDSHRLQKLTFDGACVASVGSRIHGNHYMQFKLPVGIAVNEEGHVFVADSGNHRIQVFNADLTFMRTIFGNSAKGFNHPWDVCVLSLGEKEHLYVADFGNHRVLKLTMAGEFIQAFGSEGSAPNQLNFPTAITIRENLMFVCQGDNNRVTLYDVSKTPPFLGGYGAKGSKEGEFNTPHGITSTKSGDVWICDTYNNRLVSLY